MKADLKKYEAAILSKFSFLTKLGYILQPVKYNKPDSLGTVFPDLPSVKVEYINSSRRVTIEIYNNFYPAIYIYTDKGHSLRFADYLEKKYDAEIGVHTMPGSTVENRLEEYIELVVKEFKTKEISEVLRGESWIDIPLDWGPYK